jgi:hypothetical protein
VRDRRAADGELAEAERIIRKGGRIKYAGIWWQHDRLKEFVGETVMVCSDYWRTELDVFNLPTLDRNLQHLNILSPNHIEK